MKLAVAERILAAVAAVATLLAVVDAYVFKSRLVAALRLPANLPTGVAILMFVGPATIALLLVSRVTRSADRAATLGAELAILQRDYESLSSQLVNAKQEAQALKSEANKFDENELLKASFRKQIIALLATHYYDEEDLRAFASVYSGDMGQKALFREVISDLLSEGIISNHGGGKFALRRL